MRKKLKNYNHRIRDDLYEKIKKVSNENDISFTKMIVKSMPKLRAIKLENVLRIGEILRKSKNNNKQKSRVVSFYYDEEVHKKLFRKAVVTSSSVSFLIKRLLILYVESHKNIRKISEINSG